MVLKLYLEILLFALKMESKDARTSPKEWAHIAVIDCCKPPNTTHSLAPITITCSNSRFQKLLFANYTPLSNRSILFLESPWKKVQAAVGVHPRNQSPFRVQFSQTITTHKIQKAPKSAQDPMTARTALWGHRSDLHKQGRVFTSFRCSGTCRIRPFHRDSRLKLVMAQAWTLYGAEG